MKRVSEIGVLFWLCLKRVSGIGVLIGCVDACFRNRGFDWLCWNVFQR